MLESGVQPLLKRDHGIPGDFHALVRPDRVDGKELGGQVKLVSGQGEAGGPNPVRRLDLGHRQFLCHLGVAVHQFNVCLVGLSVVEFAEGIPQFIGFDGPGHVRGLFQRGHFAELFGRGNLGVQRGGPLLRFLAHVFAAENGFIGMAGGIILHLGVGIGIIGHLRVLLGSLAGKGIDPVLAGLPRGRQLAFQGRFGGRAANNGNPAPEGQ